MKIQGLVPAELSKFLGSSLTQGYKTTNQLFRNTEFLDWSLGMEQRPYIRRAAIEFVAHRNSGRVKGLQAAIRKNKSGNCSHLELQFDEIIITFCHLGLINGELPEMPRKALFRDALSRDNTQQTLMAQLFAQEEEKTGKIISAIVIHTGNEKPETAQLIVPSKENKRVLDSMPIFIKGQSSIQDEVIEDFDIPLKEFKKDLGYGN